MSEQVFVVKIAEDRRVVLRVQVEEDVSFPTPLEREEWIAVPTSEEHLRLALGRLLGWKLAEFRAVKVGRADLISEKGKKIGEVFYE